MKKSRLQEIYKEVKRKRRVRKASPVQTKGCRTCGKSNWKPNQQ